MWIHIGWTHHRFSLTVPGVESKTPPKPPAEQLDNSKYHAEQLFSYNSMSFYEIEAAMSSSRCPQPSSIKKASWQSSWLLSSLIHWSTFAISVLHHSCWDFCGIYLWVTGGIMWFVSLWNEFVQPRWLKKTGFLSRDWVKMRSILFHIGFGDLDRQQGHRGSRNLGKVKLKFVFSVKLLSDEVQPF